MVAMGKIIRRQHGIVKNGLPAIEVIRPCIGQRLEQAECSQQFTNAAYILPVITTVFGITRIVQVA